LTYLELCWALCREAGISPALLTDVVGHDRGSELDRVCQWISQAWEEIKLHREDWHWAGHLSDKNDKPSLPEPFHPAIVALALQKYAAYEAAPEVYAYAMDRFSFYLARIEMDQLNNRIKLGAPLV
jgi:hypothetical protein